MADQSINPTTAEMDPSSQPASAPAVDQSMEWQEEEKISQESTEGASDGAASWSLQLNDPTMVAIRKLFKDVASHTQEAANDIEYRGYNRHNMDLLKSLQDICNSVGKDIESLSQDIAAVMAKEKGTDTGSAQGNYGPAAPVSCQKFGPITILLLLKLLPASRSVGIVFVEVESDGQRSITVCGTCFRVGSKYVMTCKHVHDLIVNYLSENPGEAYVEFNFCENPQSSLQVRFLINYNEVPWYSNISDLDCCVLEIVIPDDKSLLVQKGLQALSPLVRDVKNSGTITLIGHPGGDVKAMDPSCPFPHPDIGVYLKHNPQPTGDLSQLIDQRRVTYSSIMGHGSSGSPGFDEDGNLVVMHACGYRPHGQNMEQGIKMTAIRDDLRNKCPALCEELFPTPQGSST